MYLENPIANHLRLTERQRFLLERAEFKTVRDILWHFPVRYSEFREPKAIADLEAEDGVAVTGRIIQTKIQKTWRKKLSIAQTLLSDGTGTLRITWFNQPYMGNILQPDRSYTFSGKIKKDKKGLYLANPDYEESITAKQARPLKNTLIPIYSETRGLHSKWFQFAIQKILTKISQETFRDPIPAEILKRYHLPSLKTALFSIHVPRTKKIAEAARKRFAFEEIFLIQLNRQKNRMKREKEVCASIHADPREIQGFIASFPFEMTAAQKRATRTIITDLKKPKPMARLLEGDVGSGKTAVSAVAIFAATQNKLQSSYMAPTEVLAHQHYREFIERFRERRISIGLITSSECRKFPSKAFPNQDTHVSRTQLLRWVAGGEIPILIGTHALIQDRVQFKNLALIIVDEQHRFGINQRAKLVQKGTPHLLSMTATPIPRTLALTIYGDLDLTLLDEMPPGRKKVTTVIVPASQRPRAYEQMRSEIKKGRQAYVVCPRIEESTDAMQLEMKSVKEEHKKLAEKVFPEFVVDLLHGKMTPKEKENVMQKFRDGKTNILVATSVIEVGVNVPNATIIMIEGAERFGLAQLHQLRGRVLRSTHQPYCFIFSQSPSQKTLARLKALIEAKNGFELAEYDLRFRGPGELSGRKQWGISDTGMEALKNIKMVEAARAEARTLLEKDFELKNEPELARLASKFKNLHFE
ncbi:ATP-dependent DNA helicase RecG [Patescibacteria group bacterium]|nr:ATP-dependent DNA helicase RecG [Patescibacteria group bacterium]